jgi:hypothetical protein
MQGRSKIVMSKSSAFFVATCLACALPMTANAASKPATPAHRAPAPPPKVAPADEYFGRMKMSILGITNSIRDTGTREGFDPANAARYYSTLALTEDALEDWSHKYPHDSWIPQRAYDISHDFWRMGTPQAKAEANRCRWILISQFPHDRLAAIARKENASMFAPPVTAAVVAPVTHP